MDSAPRGTRGCARGFHPLENDSTPLDSSQHRKTTNASRLGYDSLSASTPIERPALQVLSGGAEFSRKRRRLPGPLGLLQEGCCGSRAAKDSGGQSAEEDGHRAINRSRRSNTNPPHGSGEVGGGHFVKGPWLSLCSAVDMPIPEDGARDDEAVHTYLHGAVAPISGVLGGEFDLRVPVLMAVIDSVNKLSQGDVAVELMDPSGTMRGYFHPGCVEEHGPELAAGAALLLKEVSLFVSGPGTTRLLNIHPSCILAVFPADVPTPKPTRLDWLRTCDTPFTPKYIPKTGRGSPIMGGNYGARSPPPSLAPLRNSASSPKNGKREHPVSPMKRSAPALPSPVTREQQESSVREARTSPLRHAMGGNLGGVSTSNSGRGQIKDDRSGRRGGSTISTDASLPHSPLGSSQALKASPQVTERSQVSNAASGGYGRLHPGDRLSQTSSALGFAQPSQRLTQSQHMVSSRREKTIDGKDDVGGDGPEQLRDNCIPSRDASARARGNVRSSSGANDAPSCATAKGNNGGKAPSTTRLTHKGVGGAESAAITITSQPNRVQTPEQPLGMTSLQQTRPVIKQFVPSYLSECSAAGRRTPEGDCTNAAAQPPGAIMSANLKARPTNANSSSNLGPIQSWTEPELENLPDSSMLRTGNIAPARSSASSSIWANLGGLASDDDDSDYEGTAASMHRPGSSGLEEQTTRRTAGPAVVRGNLDSPRTRALEHPVGSPCAVPATVRFTGEHGADRGRAGLGNQTAGDGKSRKDIHVGVIATGVVDVENSSGLGLPCDRSLGLEASEEPRGEAKTYSLLSSAGVRIGAFAMDDILDAALEDSD